VFYQLNAVEAFNRVIDVVRHIEYRKAIETGREVVEGSKYLLMKNKEHLRKDERPPIEAAACTERGVDHRLYPEGLPEKALAVQIPSVGHKSALPVVYIANESGIKSVIAFAMTLLYYAYGINN
jgi:hypothetical protein